MVPFQLGDSVDSELLKKKTLKDERIGVLKFTKEQLQAQQIGKRAELALDVPPAKLLCGVTLCAAGVSGLAPLPAVTEAEAKVRANLLSFWPHCLTVNSH